MKPQSQIKKEAVIGNKILKQLFQLSCEVFLKEAKIMCGDSIPDVFFKQCNVNFKKVDGEPDTIEMSYHDEKIIISYLMILHVKSGPNVYLAKFDENYVCPIIKSYPTPGEGEVLEYRDYAGNWYKVEPFQRTSPHFDPIDIRIRKI